VAYEVIEAPYRSHNLGGAKRRTPIWEQSWSPSQSVTNTPMAKETG